MHSQNAASLFFLVFLTVLIAELIGDKAIYIISSLAARFRAAPIFLGVSIAFMCKMLAAVLIAQLLQQLRHTWAPALSSVALLCTGVFLWRERSQNSPVDNPEQRGLMRLVAVSFCAIFFSEWADAGQLAAAAVALRCHRLFLVWSAASAALMSKSALAMFIGVRLRGLLPVRALRAVAVGACFIVAGVGIAEILR